MNVTIKSKGYENFTGLIGQIRFTDGVSEDITKREADMLGALVSIEDVDTKETLGASQRLLNSLENRAPIAKPSQFGEGNVSKDIIEQEYKKNPNKRPVREVEVKPEDGSDLTSEADTPSPQAQAVADSDEIKSEYTKEELEAIADKKGITGLREIGEPIGVRGTSIQALILMLDKYYKGKKLDNQENK